MIYNGEVRKTWNDIGAVSRGHLKDSCEIANTYVLTSVFHALILQNSRVRYMIIMTNVRQAGPVPAAGKRYVIPRPRNLYNFLVALFVACGSLCYGYASSISAALIGSPAWYHYFGLVAGNSHTNSILGAINGECSRQVRSLLTCEKECMLLVAPLAVWATCTSQRNLAAPGRSKLDARSRLSVQLS